MLDMRRPAKDLNAEAAKLGFTFESALRTLQEASEAARETTSRPATAETRPEITEGTPARPAPHLVTAQELFGEVAPTRQAKPRQKYQFDPELLNDPKAVSAAESIANARTYKMRKGIEVTPDEDARGKMAASFVKQAQRRRQGTNPSAG
jgi:hypothetical protein